MSSGLGEYAGAAEFENRWRELASVLDGREAVAGRSALGRPLWRFDLGARTPGAPVVLLTALVHGIEVIGSVALFQAVRALPRTLLEEVRFVVMPMVNTDAMAVNLDRLARGRIAWQRRNARGVDLNRNFPVVGKTRSWHPFSGSKLRLSPYYRGPHPLSEPETRAVHDVADEIRPTISLGFHSFGNMLLYPWAHSRLPNPRLAEYARLADAFTTRALGPRYRPRQAVDLYPTVGDLDDWLDTRFGTLALTVEVGSLDRRLLNPLRLINPFCWMNPSRARDTADAVAPGVVGLVGAALAGA